METSYETTRSTGVTIRKLDEADLPALVRLAQLDSSEVPEGDLIGAEIEGRLVAAVQIHGRDAIADPFSRTAELRALLELRAIQLRAREQEGRRRFAPGRRPRPALAGSTTGSGSRLLSLHMRSF